MKVTIRKAQEKDIPVILDITREAFSKYAFDLGQPDKVKALKETEETIRADMHRKVVLVGELDGVPVGTIRYEQISPSTAYISRFGVRLAAQSCGLGSALVNAVVTNCKEMGLSAVLLHTSAKMYSLIRFYYGKGFFISSTSTDRGYVRALLVKELAPTGEIIDYAQQLSSAL